MQQRDKKGVDLVQVVELLGSPAEIDVAQGCGGGDLDAWFNTFRILQVSFNL